MVILCVLSLSLSAQTRTDAYEPNNSASAAYPLTMGSFNLNFSSGDEDWFSFRLSSPTMLRINTGGDLDTKLYLYGPNSETTEITSDDDGGTDYNARIAVYLSEPGTYYIQAIPYDGDTTGPYTLVLETTPLAADSLEPNNRRDQAKTISISRLPRNLTLFPSDDSDWFKLDLDSFRYGEGEVISLYTSGDTDTCMELYEGDIPLAENDDGADDSYNAKITFKPERGVSNYYVKIRGYDNSTGEYVFHAETSIEEFDQYEPNNDKTRATNIAIGQTLSGNALAEYDSVDWFTFSISQRGTYTIGTSGGMDTVITLYDDKGSEVASDDDGGRNSNALIETGLERGTYYAEVTRYDSGIYEEYSFFVRQQ